jgi:hypothetical protein
VNLRFGTPIGRTQDPDLLYCDEQSQATVAQEKPHTVVKASSYHHWPPAAVCGSVSAVPLLDWFGSASTSTGQEESRDTASQDRIPDRPPFHRSQGPHSPLTLVYFGNASCYSAARLFRCIKPSLTLSPHAALKLVPLLLRPQRSSFPRLANSPSPVSIPPSFVFLLSVISSTISLASLHYLYLFFCSHRLGRPLLHRGATAVFQPAPPLFACLRHSTLSASLQLPAPSSHHPPQPYRPQTRSLPSATSSSTVTQCPVA